MSLTFTERGEMHAKENRLVKVEYSLWGIAAAYVGWLLILFNVAFALRFSWWEYVATIAVGAALAAVVLWPRAQRLAKEQTDLSMRIWQLRQEFDRDLK